MSLKKIFVSCLLIVGTTLSAGAVELDYTLGFDFGFQNNSVSTQQRLKVKPGSSSDLKNISWNLGGFAGIGAVFGETLTHAVGFEWTGQFQSSTVFAEEKNASNSDKLYYVTQTAFGQFADIYYRLGLNFIKAIPMSIQFNTGLAHRMMLSRSREQPHITGVRVDYYNGTDIASMSAFGLHMGMRYNVHMFMMGVDYSYFPVYAGQLHGQPVKSDSSRFPNNQISFTIGVTLNKAIMDSFMGK